MKQTLLFSVASFVLAACGALDSNQKSNLQIYNGREVEPTHWATKTAVYIFQGCSGTLIGPRAVLTAAHCLQNRGYFSLGFGINPSEEPTRHYEAVWWNYDKSSTALGDDIGLIELPEDVPPEFIPAHLASENQPLTGGWLVGYGGNIANPRAAKGAGILRETHLICPEFTTLDSRMKFCTSDWAQTPDAVGRPGDSGAGVLNYDQTTNKLFLLGVLHGGNDEFASHIVEIAQVREKIKSLNTHCRLKINNLPCP